MLIHTTSLVCFPSSPSCSFFLPFSFLFFSFLFFSFLISFFLAALHRPNPPRGQEAEFEYEVSLLPSLFLLLLLSFLLSLSSPFPHSPSSQGVGILSRYNFETLTHHNLSKGRGTDLNVRVVLSAIVEYRPTPSDLYHVGVHVIHWSYDKHQQCQNALETLEYVNNFSNGRPVTILDVMLGDFNIYNEWVAPMEYFHARSGPLDNNCTKVYFYFGFLISFFFFLFISSLFSLFFSFPSPSFLPSSLPSSPKRLLPT